MKKTIKVNKHYYMLYVVMVFSIFSIFGIFNTICVNDTSALTYQSTVGPEFTISPAISVSMSESDLIIDDLNPGTSSDSNIITITASSNSLGGYSLSSTVGSSTTNYTDLRLTSSDTTNKFTNLDSNKATLNNFDDNYWGYSYSTDNGTSWVSGDIDDSPLAGYNGLPVYSNTGIKLVDSNTLGTSTIKFKIGAKASISQASGAYTNTVNFIAVAEATPEPKIYMQDFTASQCQEQATDQAITVYDRRDESDYTVRYINGECWMTQNLRITGTISAADSNFSGSDFNVSEYDLKTNGASGGVCDSTNGYNNVCSRTPDSTDLSTIGGDATAKSVGAWYNYKAATAGTISGSSNSTAATSDICPAGWHLPSGPNTTSNTDFNKLVGNTTSGWQDPTTGLSAFGAVYGGYYSSGSPYSTERGYWWSTTAYDTTRRYGLCYNSSDGQFYGTSYFSRYSGRFVRCLRSS